MNTEKFIKLLESKALYFCPIRKFIDKYEGYIHEDLQEEISRLMGPIVGGEEKVLWTVENAVNHILDSCFISCWTLWTKEKLSLWTAYAGELGVVFKTSIDRLHEWLSQEKYRFIYKPVRYSNHAEGIEWRLHAPFFRRNPRREMDAYDSAFLAKATYWIPDLVKHLENLRFIFNKREEFKMEKEYRIILTTGHKVNFQEWKRAIQTLGVEYGTCGALTNFYISTKAEIDEIKKKPWPEGILVPFDFSIVEQIRVSPNAPSSFLSFVKNELNSHGVIDIPVLKSDLS
ncbi:MAG: DUF2971 domain-containing protein [Candidatus Hodarchaeota archaeon]